MTESTINGSPDFGFRSCTASAWAILRDHWFVLVSAAFFRDFISLIAGGLAFAMLIDWSIWNIVIAFVVKCLMWSALQTGYLKFCLNICDRNSVEWRDLFSAMNSGVQMLIATICLWCAVGLGLVCFVIPGLFLAVRLSLYGFALVDQKTGALNSLKMSHRMLNGFGWCAAAVFLVYLLSIFLGWLNGVFEPLMVISLCMIYLHVKTQGASQ